MKTEKELLEARHDLVKDQNALNKRMAKEPDRKSDQARKKQTIVLGQKK